MQYTNVFSRTQDEENFYIVSAQAELLGIEAVHAIQAYSSLENVNIDDSAALKIAADLDRIKDSINEIASSLRSIRAMVDPRVFYDEIRPWFVGSTAERPWVFEGVDQSDLVELDGPSSGQSSIMHALDVFLSIDHGSSPKGFMKRMRSYMPGTQQDWLEHLSQSPTPVHRLAEQHPTIREPYNQAVRALVKLRDQHIRVAALYVVSMSKSRPTCPLMRGMKIAEARGQDSPARGTGGNPVSVLLKASRDATRQAVIAA
jgi:indoleamine 2,3-dioxygenase